MLLDQLPDIVWHVIGDWCARAGRRERLTKVLVVSLFEQHLVIVCISHQRVRKPAAIGGGPPDHHDNQQDEGKQHVPETVPEPHLLPILQNNSI